MKRKPTKLLNACFSILKLWKFIEDGKPNDAWHRYDLKMGYRDAMTCLKKNGLIDDFCWSNLSVTIKGEVHFCEKK